MTCLHDFVADRIDGAHESLSDYAGKVVLVVNTASRCGFTGQYAGLEALHARYAPRGFSVLGFPCNQFGGQEPGSDADIAEFCATRFSIGFPLFARVDVNGAAAHPLFRFLAAAKPGLLGSERIKWNFTKFLCDGKGIPVARFAPGRKPETIASRIESLLDT